MLINTYQVGPLDTNNYLVIDRESKEAMLIDCSGFKQEIVNDVKAMGLTVKYILITHGHFDHVLGINRMKEALGAEVYVPKDDIILIENINQFAKQFAEVVDDIPRFDKTYEPGITFKIGNKEFNVIKTPGHTEGGVSILGNGILFTGDTLFCNSFGRTDLYGGSLQSLKHSILNVLFMLPDETKVYPGHDIATTIGAEKAHNEINKYAK